MIGLLLLILSSTSLLGQGDSLGVFENLVGSTWISSGKQLGGHDGKTVKEISWGLDGEIVKVKSYTTDPKTLKFGLRNEGVRIYNVQTQQLEFYEFDKLGGVSKGVIKTEGKSLHYEYEYGGLLLRDSWIYKSKDEYLFRVCSLSEKGECLQTYHEGKFIRQKK
ncbi:MAG: hypothetical protein ABJG47_16540 [Ekhidna sp.]